MQSKISVNSEKRISTLSHIKPRKSCLGISNFECTQNTACSFSNDFSSNSNPEDTSYIYECDRREEECRFIPLRRDPFQTQFKFLKSNRKCNEMQSGQDFKVSTSCIVSSSYSESDYIQDQIDNGSSPSTSSFSSNDDDYEEKLERWRQDEKCNSSLNFADIEVNDLLIPKKIHKKNRVKEINYHSIYCATNFKKDLNTQLMDWRNDDALIVGIESKVYSLNPMEEAQCMIYDFEQDNTELRSI